MARPVYTASAVLPTCACVDGAGGGTPGFHPLTVPTCEANRNTAGPLEAPECTTKSVELLKTVPVGDPSGMLTTNPLLTNGLPFTSPVYKEATPVTLFATQKAAAVGLRLMPQALTRLVS